MATTKNKGGIYLFLSDDRQAFIVIKSGSKNMAKERLKFIVKGSGIYNWTIARLDNDHVRQILGKYELDCLYKADADYQASEGLIAHA